MNIPIDPTPTIQSFSLKELGIVDAPPEEAFDDLTELAQVIFDVPVALVSIVEVDLDRQYFKSQQGLPEPWAGQRQTPLTHSFCQHVVADDQPLMVNNAPENTLVCDNLAIRDLNVISYLGVPIYDPFNKPIGALCVIDGKPREWTELQVSQLKQLGKCVSDAIRLKSALKTSENLRVCEQKLTEKLEKANEELGQFACVAAHDLQEPLRKIVSFSQLLKAECGRELNDDGLVYLNYMVNGATRMKSLIRDLLEFSQVDSDTIELADVSVATALENALTDLDETIRASDAIVTHDPLPQVAAEQRQLAQLLQNLIGNSIKYCDGQPKLHIGVEEASDHFVISVQDNGIGIAPEFHEQIFGIFKRLHGRTEYAGTGIGLAICKRISDRWRQKIGVESTGKNGTRFYFTVAKPKLIPNETLKGPASIRFAKPTGTTQPA